MDEYELNGEPRLELPEDGSVPASFVGPAAVGAMYDEDHQLFIDAAYDAVNTQNLTAGTIYYEKCWMVLSLMMMSGVLVDFTAE